MRRRFFILLISVFCSSGFISCDTEKNILPRNEAFVKMYGEEGDQFGVDILQLENSDLILLGRVDSSRISHVYLLRTDTLGNVIWKKNIKDLNNNSSEDPKALAIDANQNIIITGTISEPGDDSDVFLYKFSPSGQRLNNIVIDIPIDQSYGNIDVLEGIYITSDNKYLVSGYTRTTSNPVERSFNFLINDDFTVVSSWTNPTFPSQADNNATQFFRRKEGMAESFDSKRFITVVSSTRKQGEEGIPEGFNAEVIFFDKNSGIPDYPQDIQDQQVGTIHNDHVKAFIKLSSGGYAFAANVTDEPNSSIYIGVLGANGIFQRGITVTDRNLQVTDIKQINLNQFVVLGTDISTSLNHNIYIAEVDLGGNLLWEHAYGGEGIDNGAAMVVSRDKQAIYAIGTLRLDSENKIVLLKTTNRGTFN